MNWSCLNASFSHRYCYFDFRRRVGRVAQNVGPLQRIVHQVKQLLGWTARQEVAALMQQILGRAGIDVGRQMQRAVGERSDVLVVRSPERSLRIVGGVIGQLGEQLVPSLPGFAVDEWQQAHPVAVCRRCDAAELQDCGL